MTEPSGLPTVEPSDRSRRRPERSWRMAQLLLQGDRPYMLYALRDSAGDLQPRIALVPVDRQFLNIGRRQRGSIMPSA